MALSARSIAAAAKLKAERAGRKLRKAEQELAQANQELQRSLPANSGPTVARAAKRTVAAEKDVHEAAEEVEAVKTLLDDVQDDKPDKAGRRSGEGSRSVLPHLQKTRDASS